MPKRPTPAVVAPLDVARYSEAAFLAAVATRRAVAESTPTGEQAAPTQNDAIRESEASGRPIERVTVREADTSGATVTRPGRLALRLIRAGWSLNSNYYPAEVLRRDGPEAWPKGTLCYVDHATEEEDEARPSGSVRNLAAVLTSDARWDETEQALMAEARLFAPWREAITDMADTIGMSIRAWVTGEQGERDGQRGFIVQSIPEGRSVDFVTIPAAGGGIVSVLESVGNPTQVTEARNIAHWFEARLHCDFTNRADDMFGSGRLTRDERIVLSSAVGDALTAFAARVEQDAPQLLARDLWEEPERPTTAAAAEAVTVAETPTEETRMALLNAIRAEHPDGDGRYSWVRDFDPDRQVVWFEAGDDDGVKTWQQSYSVGDDGVTLAGDPVEVVARTVYQPISSPDDAAADEARGAAGANTITAAEAVTTDVTDGTPPTAPNPPIKEEPAMSGTTTGTPPVEAGTAPVADTATTPAVESQQVNVQAAVQAALAEAMGPLTQRLADVQAALAAQETQNRALRNRARASEAVAAALRAPEYADVAAQIGPRVSARILDAVPATAEGAVDDTALTEAIAAAIADEAAYVRAARAEALEAAGVGQPYGLGATRQESVDDGFEQEMTDFFTTLGMSEGQAKIAAKGR